jgi:flagellar motor switch protein FliN/FliY
MIDRLRRARDVQLELRIELGRAQMPADKAALLAPGSVVSLDTLVDQPVDIAIEGRLVARGEVLELDGSFCVRVTELVRQGDR